MISARRQLAIRASTAIFLLLVLGSCRPVAAPISASHDQAVTVAVSGRVAVAELAYADFTVVARDSESREVARAPVDKSGQFRLKVPQGATFLLEAQAGRSLLLAHLDVNNRPARIRIDVASTLMALGLTDTADAELALIFLTQLRAAQADANPLLSHYQDSRALLQGVAQDKAQRTWVRLRYHDLLMEQEALRRGTPAFAVRNPEMTQMLRLDAATRPLRWQQQTFAAAPWACVDFFEKGHRYGYTSRQWPLGVRLFAVDAAFSALTQSQAHAHLRQLNQRQHCQRSHWRLPYVEEVRTLFDAQTGAFLYPRSLPFSGPGAIWVISAQGQLQALSFPALQPLDAHRAQLAQLLPFSFTADAPPPPNPIVDSQLNARQLRALYQRPSAQWPAPTVDAGVHWQELAPLPAVPFPADNAYSPEKVALGKRLFFDVNLSAARNIACASCHVISEQWSDKRRVSIGTHATAGVRNAMPIQNSAFNPLQFWDGRAASLEAQSLHPIIDPLEMALTPAQLLLRLAEDGEYPALFSAAFGATADTSAISLLRYQQALATYQRSLISKPSSLDRFIQGQTDALSDEQILGLHVYRTKARCMNCHSGPLMTDFTFRNTGLTYYGRRLEDHSRFAHSFARSDMGRFRVPSLRDVAFTAPYMHNGVFPQLAGVINFYNVGMTKGRNTNYPQYQHKYDPFFPVVDDLIEPLGMTPNEMRALIAFLHALSAPARTDSAPLEVLRDPAREIKPSDDGVTLAR